MRLNLFEDPFGRVPISEFVPFADRWLPGWQAQRYLKWMVVASLVAIATATIAFMIDRFLKSRGLK